MDTRSRRWLIRGAFAGVLIAFVLGLALNFFVAFVDETSRLAVTPAWQIVLGTAIFWGVPGAFFGAVLGAFASLMWKPRD